MSERCGDQHRAWMEQLAAEGREALGGEAVADLQACPDCRLELADLGRLQDLLGGAAGEQRETLASLTPAQLERELEFVSEVHRRHLAPRAAPTMPRVRPARIARLVGWLAAAGVLATLYLVWRAPTGPALPANPSSDDELLAPSDHPMAASELRVESSAGVYESLRWTSEATTVTSWRVVVEDAAGDEQATFERVHGTMIELGLERTFAWPDRIYVRVTPRDLSGRLIGEAEVEAVGERSR
ncbi:MAG TPA: hypothetical protein VMT18_02305 [Planctomycetota bacterium]|nr:hypothetical protein [Planctomycetota bacterium]